MKKFKVYHCLCISGQTKGTECEISTGKKNGKVRSLDNIEIVRLFNPLNELDIVYPMNVRAKEKLEKKD
jgi:hypothetical protein